MWHDCFALPLDDPTFGAPRPRTRNTYEHNLIKPVPHIEQGDIFDDFDDEIIRVEQDMVNEKCDYRKFFQTSYSGRC